MKKLKIALLCLFLVACSSPAKEDTKDTTKKEEVKDTTVSFFAVGDNLLHDTINAEAKTYGETSGRNYDYRPFYKNFEKQIQGADVAFINQETIVGGEELGISGYPNFNSPKEVASDLATTGFDLVNLASNHSLDRSSQGIINALQTFDFEKNLTVAGINDSEERKNEIATFKQKGITFSFLAYTYGTNGIIPENAYEVNYFGDERIASDVAKAKEVSDVVIVSAHWGDENAFELNDMQQHYAQVFADAGVDVVIGTHPHVVQPDTWVDGKDGHKTYVIYSLGNFLGGMLDTKNIVGSYATFDIVKDGKTDDISVKNEDVKPLVIDFHGNQNNILDERYDYTVLPLTKEYDKVASNHVLHGYEGQVVSYEELLRMWTYGTKREI
ncbi:MULTISPECIES: CapA family protein [unclassified Breznakia]|uniref:CapA family protein n=1 Tax=unclassified Breznakia TaxID=2623764 RepID=UPI0024751645|nr:MULTISPECIES: CapA family protein [unclassified Breznakia]MDH6366155.1 hypothetical protein [Breznakia sp. PH1-1]MDH6403248.1 hypothetical protein [Breznakia sp. PF1-11]MDH6410957.1 hypothetical protein [Breznakia sp. PFB1-11]MDH6413321.1 hypothetical protein [Breznakia sp. PFB1-14]MDH6416086.1 hypothetical protein [Breznakia sp. PFB1-4]